MNSDARNNNDNDNAAASSSNNRKFSSGSGRAVRVSRPIFTQTKLDSRYEASPAKNSNITDWRPKQLISDCRPSKQCMLNGLLQFLPFISIMSKYRAQDLVSDIVAGLTVGVMNIPQGMAYAILADLAPVYGLYLGFFPLIVYFFFGTSRHVSMGTFAITSLMVAVPVARLIPDGPTPELVQLLPTPPIDTDPAMNGTTDGDLLYYRVQVALSVTLLAGLIQLALGLLRFGFITVYLGAPLVSGFTTGAAIHVMTSQVPPILGVSVTRRSGLLKLMYTYADIVLEVPNVNWISIGISVVCIGILLAFRLVLNPKLRKRCRFPVPVELILVIAGTLLSHFLQLNANHSVSTVGQIPSGLRQPQLPALQLFPLLIQDAILIAIVMYVTSYSVSRVYANKHNYSLDANQELFANGLVNSICPVFGCYFSGGSLSRSQVMDDMGCSTQVASLVGASMMLLVLLLLGPLFESLPTAVLASIIIVALKGLFMQFGDAKRLFEASKYDFSIWIVCFLGVVIGDVSYGLAIGFAYSLLTVVCRTQSPSGAILGRLPQTDIYKTCSHYPAAVQEPGVTVFRFDGALYFASVDNFRRKLVALTGFDPRLTQVAEYGSTDNLIKPHHIVIDCSGINFIDIVGVKLLTTLETEYRLVNCQLLLAACKRRLRQSLHNGGFPDECDTYVCVHDAVLAALAAFPNQRQRLVSEVRNRADSCWSANAESGAAAAAAVAAAAAANININSNSEPSDEASSNSISVRL